MRTQNKPFLVILTHLVAVSVLVLAGVANAQKPVNDSHPLVVITSGTYSDAAIKESKKPLSWIVTPNSRLREVVHAFSVRAGWTDIWCIRNPQTLEDQDYVLSAGIRTEGDYKKAITDLFSSLPDEIKVRAQLWPENSPPLLYVIREGEVQQCN